MRSGKPMRVVAVSALIAMGLGGALHAALPPAPATPTLVGPGVEPINLEQVMPPPSPLRALVPATLAERAAAWDVLSLPQRQARRARYQAWSELAESERALLRTSAAEFAGLDATRQQALRQEFAALDLSQQRGWRLGPVLGADYPRLHSLLAYLPDAQRLPMLEALRGLDRQQRAELAVLAQRTAPHERQALRAELLATAPGQRAAWLQERLRR